MLLQGLKAVVVSRLNHSRLDAQFTFVASNCQVVAVFNMALHPSLRHLGSTLQRAGYRLEVTGAHVLQSLKISHAEVRRHALL